jgi:hypothetical protein
VRDDKKEIKTALEIFKTEERGMSQPQVLDDGWETNKEEYPITMRVPQR